MPIELQTALIAGFIAVLTSGIGSYFNWRQIQRERIKWLTDIKLAYAMELYKARLAAYPDLQEIIGQLSWQEHIPFTPERAQQVAAALNEWHYSVGGLIIGTSTRSALLGLRNACVFWKEGPQPEAILELRNALLLLMRRDLDIIGLGSDEAIRDQRTLLDQLREEIRQIETARG